MGARPNFLKVDPDLEQTLIHTGQHWSDNMSKDFFQELSLPEPVVNLGKTKTGEMIDAIEKQLEVMEPDLVIVYGDTNSSFAGAYAAAQMGIKVAHVEAGLRSRNKGMREENNRILIDHLSTFRFIPTLSAWENLEAEGLVSGNYLVGDVLLDRILISKPKVVEKKDYLLLTLHRKENVDYPNKVIDILTAIGDSKEEVIWPLHPRTKKTIDENKIEIPSNIKVLDPQGYLSMIKLEAESKMILTDSGGVQKEAYYLEVPCVTLRDETEWGETIADGLNILVGHDQSKITDAIAKFKPFGKRTFGFGDGHAFEQIRKVLTQNGY